MKRLLTGLMAVLMIFTLFPTAALAAGTPTQAEAAQILAALDIMTGDATGDMRLAANVTRAEFTKLAVAASPYRDSVGPETTTSPYPDVPRTHWAAGYIQAAVGAGLIQGDLYGNFNPDKTITLAEGATILLRLLGYQKDDFTGAYPTGQLALYRTLNLDEGVTVAKQDAVLTRGDALYLFYNLLTAKTREGVVYITLLKPNQPLLNAAGEIDLVALVNTAMDGPVVVQGTAWKAKVPFDTEKATVYRGGRESTASSIAENDVVYWSKSMRTLWAYNNKVSGTLQSVTPTSAPTTVALAGKSYSIETTSAAYALSDLGTYKVGDSVTLLLGRDSKVAAVLKTDAVAGGEVYGLVTKVTAEPYTDADGNDYTASTLHVLGTDGSSYTYRWDKQGIKAGSMVRVATSKGALDVSTLSGGSTPTGKVSADGSKIGDREMAEDVEILDVYQDQGKRIYPARLAGTTLDAEDVRYCLYNAQGEISRLILRDFTGDVYQYGLLTEVSEVSADMYTSGNYAYDIAGVTGAIQGSKIYNLKEGPFWMRQKEGVLDKIGNLTKIEITGIDGHTAMDGSQQYTIWEDAVVYEKLSGDRYFVTSLGVVADGDYTVTGWYDKAERDGGRIRILIAEAQ